MSRPRIGIVIHRYGDDITGGSESHARQIAERLTAHYDIEVITTCAVDHLSWKNVYPAGQSTINGVNVRRFRVAEERDHFAFHGIYDRLFTEDLTLAEETKMVRHQGPYCPELVEWIGQKQDEYDAFIFFTYIYYTTIFGLPLVRHKSVFVPTAHDEKSLYFHILDDIFKNPPYMLFNSGEEQLLLERRFTLPRETGRIVGLGIDDPHSGPVDADWAPLQQKLEGKRILTYLGRVENGKGCDEMVDFFMKFVRHEAAEDIVLLLLGKRTMPLPAHKQILSPGYVSAYAKYQALQMTDIAIAPSPLESLCLAALESWMHRLPLLVNGHCPVLTGHCVRSNGGLWYSSYAEFRESLKILLDDERVRGKLGDQGRAYVEQNYRWSRVEAAYLEVLDEICGKARPARQAP